VLKKLEETPRGPRLILSRADPLFVKALFGLEVPEIYQSIVEIREIVREAGGRTKVAVYSRDDSIDPVGACVGLKGARVQAVVSELGGERIDIVPWHPDPEIFARRALAPARVAKVLSDSARRVITAIVDEDQLSLAIGRNGQNVRLASQLIGWQIDLYSSRDWLARGAESALFGGGDEYEIADFPLSELEGLTPASLAALQAAGIDTFLAVLDMDRDDFLRVPGIDESEAERIVALIDELTVVEEPTVPTPQPSTSIFAIGQEEETGSAEESSVEEAGDVTGSPAADESDSEGEAESVEVAAAASEEKSAGGDG
jgi:N utilization substance protein A